MSIWVNKLSKLETWGLEEKKLMGKKQLYFQQRPSLLTTSYEFFYARSQCWLGHSTNNCIFLLTILEDHNSRDASNSIPSSGWRALIRVEFVTLELPSILLCQFIYYRVNHSAGTTPWRPEFNQNSRFRFKDKGLPICISNRSHCNM